MVKMLNIKRRYFDMRQGMITVSPAIQISNFIMLAYLTISEIIPFYVFVPLFVIASVIGFTLIGNRFRNIQWATDINLGYEKSTELVKTTLFMMDAQIAIMESMKITIPSEYMKRYHYLSDIADGRK